MKLRDVNRAIFSDVIDTMQMVQDYCEARGASCDDCPFENDTDDHNYFCFLSGSSPLKWKLNKLRRPEIEKEN